MIKVKETIKAISCYAFVLFLFWVLISKIVITVFDNYSKESKRVMLKIKREQLERKIIEQSLVKVPKKYHKIVIRLCKENNVPISVFVNLVYYESRWKQYAYNRNWNGTIDAGLCQINSCNYYWMKKAYFTGKGKLNLYNPRHNLELGVKFLSDLGSQFNRNWKKVLAAYNAGPYAVQTNRIPRSTRIYVKRILSKSNPIEGNYYI